MDKVRDFRSALEKIDTILFWILVLIIACGGVWFAVVGMGANIKIAAVSILDWLPFAVSVWLIRVFAVGIGFTLIQIAEHTLISATTLVKFQQQQKPPVTTAKNQPATTTKNQPTSSGDKGLDDALSLMGLGE